MPIKKKKKKKKRKKLPDCLYCGSNDFKTISFKLPSNDGTIGGKVICTVCKATGPEVHDCNYKEAERLAEKAFIDRLPF